MKKTTYRHLKKGELIVQAGQIQNELFLLETGVARGYFLNINGKEITDCLIFRSGWAAIGFCPLEMDVQSPMTIEMLEAGTFFCLPISTVLELESQYPEITQLYNRMLIASLNEHWKLKQILNQCTAIERYQWFLENYPGLINRISNKYIASLIGMTPVTLSRLRSQLRTEREQGL